MKNDIWFEFSPIVPIWYDTEIKDTTLKIAAEEEYKRWLNKMRARAKFAKIFKEWGLL